MVGVKVPGPPFFLSAPPVLEVEEDLEGEEEVLVEGLCEGHPVEVEQGLGVVEVEVEGESLGEGVEEEEREGDTEVLGDSVGEGVRVPPPPSLPTPPPFDLEGVLDPDALQVPPS